MEKQYYLFTYKTVFIKCLNCNSYDLEQFGHMAHGRSLVITQWAEPLLFVIQLLVDNGVDTRGMEQAITVITTDHC